MELLFLGTASGTPTKTRNVSAVALRRDNTKRWCLIDCGEGTQHQLLHTTLSLKNLGTICITHIHGDHCYGLPGVLSSAALAGRTAPLRIIAPQGIRAFIDGVIQSTQMHLTFPLEFIDVASTEGVSDDDFDIEITTLSHRVPSFAFAFTERGVQPKLDVEKLKNEGVPGGPLLGRLKQAGTVTLPDGRTLMASDYLLPLRAPRKIVVAGDNDTPELLGDAIQGADILVHEATYTEETLQKVGPMPQHSSARRVAAFAAQTPLTTLILTHLSPRYSDTSEIETEASCSFDRQLFFADDFDMFHLNIDKTVTRSRPRG